MPVTAELQRKNALGEAVPYVLVDDTENTETLLSDPTVDFGARSRLEAIIQRLESVLARLPDVPNADGGLKVHLQNQIQSDGLTDTELRASPVDVSIASGSISFPSTVEVSNDQGSPLSVSGSVTANLGTLGGAATETTLAAILAELNQKLESGGEVALSAATLSALENITVTVANPAADPETGLTKETTLQALLTELGQKLEPGDAVALDTDTLAALENLSVTVTAGVQTDALTDTELRASPVDVNVTGGQITFPSQVEIGNDIGNPIPVTGVVGVSGTVNVAEPVTVDGTVNVANQPTTFPLPSAQLTTLAPQTDALTDAQLRSSPVDVAVTTGTVEVTNIAALAVVNALEVAAHDLQATAYSGTTVTTNDYLLSRLEMAFTTTEARTVTVRTADTLLWERVVTNRDIALDFGNVSFDAGDEITVQVSQTTGPCVVGLTLVVQQGSAMLGGNPVLGESTAKIGTVDIDVAAGAAGDAFARLRTSQPFTLLDATHEYDASPLFWAEWASSGSGIAHLPQESGVDLVVDGTVGSFCRFQSRRYLRYQPGKGGLIIMTGVFGEPDPAVVRRKGYFDQENGLFHEDYGTEGSYLVRRTNTSGSVVDHKVHQSEWNRDSLDGTGPSGITMDRTKMQLFHIDFQWLSIGRIRFWFDIGGRPILVHEVTLSNEIDVPYMRTANLPIRYEIENLATSGVEARLKAICATVMTEGGQDQTGIAHSVSNHVQGKLVNGSDVPILTVRLKTLFRGLTNRGSARVANIEMFSDVAFHYEVILDPVLTGAVWNSAEVNSICEYDVASTACSGGEVFDAGYVAGGSKNIGNVVLHDMNLEQLVLSLDPAGLESRTISIVGHKMGGNATVFAAIKMLEEF